MTPAPANTVALDWDWPLSQKLSKLMGGEIFVESELEKEARFTIRVPLLSGRPKGDAFAFRDARPCSFPILPSKTTDA